MITRDEISKKVMDIIYNASKNAKAYDEKTEIKKLMIDNDRLDLFAIDFTNLVDTYKSGIKISVEEVRDSKTVGDCIDLVYNKITKQ